MFEFLEDFWSVRIKGLHKHKFVRIEDGQIGGMKWQQHRCLDCKKVLNLDDWQINDLPLTMRYEKIDRS